MSYLTQSKIAVNPYMTTRVAQCAAEEGQAEPDSWAGQHSRQWGASPGWDEAWEYAVNTHPDEPDYDPGADETVITDQMILSTIQPMLTEA
jgi:hypothetical protein